jgi:DNA-binding MarR family transcriptional regulator/GNAT superfamily N-acetyltransferase
VEQSARDAGVEAVRRFNRLYTRRIGVLERRYLESPFALTEARVLYELAQAEPVTAAELRQTLGLNAGYLSRLLRGFAVRGLVTRRRSESDGRRRLLSLTPAGRSAYERLDAAAGVEIAALLGELSEPEQRRVVEAMRTIETLLGGEAAAPLPYLLRPLRAGDGGWVVQRHGALYAREHGWNEEFEALVAEIVATFLRGHEARRECAWIAERGGAPVGSVFLVRHPEREGVARLRLLLVEPEARGLGIGGRLVRECTRFAREAGYARITLWTNSVLVAARRLYEAEGYRLVASEPYHGFGLDLVGETWELEL